MKNEIEQLKDVLLDSDAILIGAGSGMSAAAGMDWWYQASPVYKQHFGDFMPATRRRPGSSRAFMRGLRAKMSAGPTWYGCWTLSTTSRRSRIPTKF